jgi:hypothetical protein
MIVSGNTASCFTCANALTNTLAKATTTTCSCVSNTMTWNPTKVLCDCGTTANTIISGSGTANAKCATCTPSTYMVGASADLKSCVCIGKLTWTSGTSTCGCTSPTTTIIVGTAYSTQCVTCSSIQFAGTVATLTTCNCIGVGMTFSSALGSCSCPANNIILPNLNCAACPDGATPYTPYECLCAPGYVWIPAKGCIQCGSSTLTNSLPNGGTNFACACSSGFTWDVMTLGCIATSTCATTPTASCMKCPSGVATALTAATLKKDLLGGTAIQVLLAGTFTNYNQIKGFACTCAST